MRADFQFSGRPKKKWRVKDSQLRVRFESEVSASISRLKGGWIEVECKVLTICNVICGLRNNSVQDLVKEKKLAFKKRQHSKSETDRVTYRHQNNQVRPEVEGARAETWAA